MPVRPRILCELNPSGSTQPFDSLTLLDHLSIRIGEISLAVPGTLIAVGRPGNQATS